MWPHTCVYIYIGQLCVSAHVCIYTYIYIYDWIHICTAAVAWSEFLICHWVSLGVCVCACVFLCVLGWWGVGLGVITGGFENQSASEHEPAAQLGRTSHHWRRYSQTLCPGDMTPWDMKRLSDCMCDMSRLSYVSSVICLVCDCHGLIQLHEALKLVVQAYIRVFVTWLFQFCDMPHFVGDSIMFLCLRDGTCSFLWYQHFRWWYQQFRC